MAIVKRQRKNGTAWMVRVEGHPARTFDSKGEARQHEGTLLNRRSGSGETVGGFHARWLTDFPREYESTRGTLRRQTRAFAEKFADRRMDSITKREAREWARANRAKIRGVKAMFGDAVKDETVAANPFDGVSPPKYSRADREPPDEKAVFALADACDVLGSEGVTFRAMVLTAGLTGARFGELVAVEWPWVGDGVLRLQRAYMGEGNSFKRPKSGEGRVVALPWPAQEAILAVPRRLDRCPSAVSSEGFVFRPGRAEHFRPCSHHGRWKKVREAAGFPGLEWHMLRHACATMMLRNGASPEQVAQQLGHRDGGALIRQRYGHLLSDESVRRALDGIRSALPSHKPDEGASVSGLVRAV